MVSAIGSAVTAFLMKRQSIYRVRRRESIEFPSITQRVSSGFEFLRYVADMSGSAFITRVVLENYKSIADCDISLSPLTFFVGPNGSGKSNFLDALSFGLGQRWA